MVYDNVKSSLQFFPALVLAPALPQLCILYYTFSTLCKTEQSFVSSCGLSTFSFTHSISSVVLLWNIAGN